MDAVGTDSTSQRMLADLTFCGQCAMHQTQVQQYSTYQSAESCQEPWATSYSIRSVGSMISCFSHSCGTLRCVDEIDVEDLEALILTFDTPEGSLCIINTSMPILPATVRARMLKKYVHAAMGTGAESIFIGGVLRVPRIFVEKQVAQLNPKF